MRRSAFAILTCLTLVTGAHAQSQPPVAPGPAARDPYITSTGETVDRPGLSQSGGTTAEDRKIQREDNRIDNGICKGC